MDFTWQSHMEATYTSLFCFKHYYTLCSQQIITTPYIFINQQFISTSILAIGMYKNYMECSLRKFTKFLDMAIHLSFQVIQWKLVNHYFLRNFIFHKFSTCKIYFIVTHIVIRPTPSCHHIVSQYQVTSDYHLCLTFS